MGVRAEDSSASPSAGSPPAKDFAALAASVESEVRSRPACPLCPHACVLCCAVLRLARARLTTVRAVAAAARVLLLSQCAVPVVAEGKDKGDKKNKVRCSSPLVFANDHQGPSLLLVAVSTRHDSRQGLQEEAPVPGRRCVCRVLAPSPCLALPVLTSP